MFNPLILDPEQEADAQRIASEPTRAALDASTMSAGKTVVALRVAELLGAQQILVVAPLQTRGGWKNTAERGWIAGEHYGDLTHLPFRWIRNTKDGNDAMMHLQFGEPGLYFIGREYAVSLDWEPAGEKKVVNQRTQKVTVKKIKKRTKFWESITPDLLIVDEVHKGHTSTSTQTYKTLSKMPRGFAHALSGTPEGNRFEGIYPVTRFLWPDVVPEKIQHFKSRWCETTYDPWSWDHMKVVDEKNPGEYFKWLPCVVKRTWKYDGVLDEDDVLVELTAAQRKAYDDLEKKMVTWLGENPFVIDFPAAKRIRLRQATLGMFYVNDDDEVDFPLDCKSSKLDALKNVLEKPEHFDGESALIFTDSKKFARVTAHRINEWYGDGAAEVWSGDQSAVKRDEIKARFISGETKYVTMVVKAGGTGTDGLQFASRNIAVLSVDDSRIENEQGEARIVRRGQGDLVRIRNIMAVDTYDMGILDKQTEEAIRANRRTKLDK